MLAEHTDLGKARVLKEDLRLIYANAKDALEANAPQEEWIAKTRASGIAGLGTMAMTMKKNLTCVLGF